MPDSHKPALEANEPCPFCGGTAHWGYIVYRGTGASGMELPDITIGCPVEGFWLKAERTEEWKQGKGTYSIEPAAKAKLLKVWDNRYNG